MLRMHHSRAAGCQNDNEPRTDKRARHSAMPAHLRRANGRQAKRGVSSGLAKIQQAMTFSTITSKFKLTDLIGKVSTLNYSIIIPTYNEEGPIRQCLESIRRQTYDRSQYEIIVSDASSTDQTLSIAKPLCDTIVSTEKRGIALGRNLGAASSVGEYLVFVDADATLQSDFLSRCDESFRDRSVVAVTGIARPADGTMFPRFVYTMTYLLVRFFNKFGLSLFPGVCVAYRAEAFRKLKGFREDFGIVEDLDLSRRASKLGKCVVQKQAIAFVSTRRLEKHALSTVLFHIYSDMKYLLTGKAALRYPKREEISTWRDLWKSKEQ